ncbi:hypothetical protein CPB83DRAFT_886586, partial [Crepidotus variabilis]
MRFVVLRGFYSGIEIAVMLWLSIAAKSVAKSTIDGIAVILNAGFTTDPLAIRRKEVQSVRRRFTLQGSNPIGLLTAGTSVRGSTLKAPRCLWATDKAAWADIPGKKTHHGRRVTCA